MAGAHHDAAERHERRGGEAELLGSEQRADDDVAPGLELPVHLDGDAAAQVVENEDLVGLGQAQLPGDPGVLDRGERGGAGPAVVPGDEHHVGVRLGHARGDGADSQLGDELHADARVLVGVLEVVDQLLEVLDRIDVVVRRRRDETHPGCRVPHLGDPRVYFVARQLAALSRFRALSNLYL